MSSNPLDQLEGVSLELVRRVLSTNSTLLQILKGAQTLDAPNWYLAGGAISQTIWNHVSSCPPDTGIRDYDLVYFDDSDLSYEAEDKVIQRGHIIFSNVATEVEIRNQARVHIWYGEKYGVHRSPLPNVEAGIISWISNTAMVGVRLERDDSWTVFAPRGIDDYFEKIVRPNPVFATKEQYDAKVARWKKVWTGLSIEAWPST